MFHILIKFVLGIFSVYFFINSKWNQAKQAFGPSAVWCQDPHGSCVIHNLCHYKGDFFIFYDKSTVFYSLQSDLKNLNSYENVLNHDLSSVANHPQYKFSPFLLEWSQWEQFSKQAANLELKSNWVVLYSRFKPDNLMHLLHDEILPLLTTLNFLAIHQSIYTNNFDLISVDEFKEANDFIVNKQLYQSLFLDKLPISLSPDSNQLLCFKRAYIGLQRNTVWYDYGFWEPQHVLFKTEHEKLHIRLMTKQIKQRIIRSEQTCNVSSAVLIRRNFTRLILNEQQLVEQLTKHFNKTVISLDLDAIDDKTLSLNKVIQTIHCSQVLVGVHGAGLTLGMFLPPNSVIIEIFPYLVNPELLRPYRYLAEIYGHQYYAWENKIKWNSQAHPEYNAEFGGVAHLNSKERFDIISSEQPLKPFKCCSDPLFLYRIYQDTLVDEDEFQKLLNTVWMKQTNKEQSLPEDLLQLYQKRPGPVAKLKCNQISKGTAIQLKISWTKPKNLAFLRDELISYQITIQDPIKQESTDYSTKLPHLQLNIDHQNQSSIVFVRCIVNNIEGQVNKESVKC